MQYSQYSLHLSTLKVVDGSVVCIFWLCTYDNAIGNRTKVDLECLRPKSCEGLTFTVDGWWQHLDYYNGIVCLTHQVK